MRHIRAEKVRGYFSSQTSPPHHASLPSDSESGRANIPFHSYNKNPRCAGDTTVSVNRGGFFIITGRHIHPVCQPEREVREMNEEESSPCAGWSDWLRELMIPKTCYSSSPWSSSWTPPQSRSESLNRQSSGNIYHRPPVLPPCAESVSPRAAVQLKPGESPESCFTLSYSWIIVKYQRP